MKARRSPFLATVLLSLMTVKFCSLGLTNASICHDLEVNISDSSCQGQVQCPACVKISWFERKPYVYRQKNKTIGILPEVLDLMLSKCCGNHTPSCWHLHHYEPISNPSRLLFEVSNAHIVYPVIVDSQDPLENPANMIGLIPPSSISFVVLKDKRESFPKKLLMSVFEAWPVLILTLLLSILAGIVLWLAEIRANPEEFPRTFIGGAWEGFWWAFVSMTTVGYGDRAPRSFLGRVFAVMWILLGICIVSIFTATLTTSLTTISLDTKRSVTGSKIGVLQRSIELSMAMQQQADITVYSSIEEIRTALDDKQISGAFLDKYFINFYEELFPQNIFKVDQVITQNKMQYGVVVNHTAIDKCFRKLLHQDRFIVYNYIKNELHRTLKIENNKVAIRNSQSIFDPTGDLFYPSLYSCVTLVIVIFLIGLVAEFAYFKPSRCLQKKQETNEGKKKEDEKEESNS
ncbi:uncharacterized protein LOC116303242 isoform X2 [Actinia tenebrosa]|uniref:Uncharacterized protein LOC116303242 isoform X2 n=1 Tax=Actinia tenebrosa TaxID=6105 RepID=A0A6P8IP06_ACTTE|nr:uncharacterized protein LOC116303242 isoform X2 [Actinia tenebrosa]